jgi:hypothetical protein
MESKYVWLNAKAQHGQLTAVQKTWMKANAASFSKKKLPKIAGVSKKVSKTTTLEREVKVLKKTKVGKSPFEVQPTIADDAFIAFKREQNVAIWKPKMDALIAEHKYMDKPYFLRGDKKDYYYAALDKHRKVLNAKVGKYKSSRAWADNARNTEERAINFYQQTFENVGAMRKLQSGAGAYVKVSAKTLEKAKEMLPLMEEVINRCPDYKGTIYRTLRLSPKNLKKLEKTSSFSIDCFTSASSSEAKAKEFLKDFTKGAFNSNKQGVIMEIASKTGAKLGKLDSTSLKEVIMKPGSKYKVISVKHGKLTKIKLEEL